MSSKDIMKEIANTFTCPGVKAGKCNSDFQDERYGNGKRVFTPTHKDNKPGKRCTICKSESA